MKAKRPFKSKDQLLFHVGKTFSESAGPYFMFTTFIGLFLFVLPLCYYAVFRSPFITVRPQDSVSGYCFFHQTFSVIIIFTIPFYWKDLNHNITHFHRRQTSCCTCSTCYTTFSAPPRNYIHRCATLFCPVSNLFTMCNTAFMPQLAPLVTLIGVNKKGNAKSSKYTTL